MTLKRYLNESRVTGPLVNAARSVYRPLRTMYLRRRYPRGGFVTGNGVKVFCDFADSSYIWYDADAPNLAFDQRVIRNALEQSQGNVFIDVGAHFGFFTSFVAGLAADGLRPMKILAFEPDRHHFTCLESTMASHSKAHVELFQVAVSDAEGTLDMYRSTDASCLHSYGDETAVPVYSVPAVTLDAITERSLFAGDRIAVIKIDVDGAEPLVFRGAERVLRDHRPIVFAEFSPKYLRRNQTEPRRFFMNLCKSFRAYWVRQELESVVEVTASDYETIEASIGVVTDLLLSDHELDLTRLRRA
jgi:FkbM family methyltransferase